MQDLISRGADIAITQKNGSTALFHAARIILANGADINCKDSNKRSSLMVAAQAGHTAMVKLLIDEGADVDYVRRVGWSAVGLGSDSKCEDIANLLGHAPKPLKEEFLFLGDGLASISKIRDQLLM